MERTVLDSKELNKRCSEVFELYDGDLIWDATIENNRLVINMEEVDQSGQVVIFDYLPDMTSRPQAVDYIMGKRADFND